MSKLTIVVWDNIGNTLWGSVCHCLLSLYPVQLYDGQISL
jgi:hypothetical protein